MQNNGSAARCAHCASPGDKGIAAPFPGQRAGGAFLRCRGREDRKENKHKWN